MEDKWNEGGTVYKDAKGRVITETEYKRIMTPAGENTDQVMIENQATPAKKEDVENA